MPKLKGEQLSLVMPVGDRPRSEWVDMHCPLLLGLKLGLGQNQIVYWGQLAGELRCAEDDHGDVIATVRFAHFESVLNRKLVADLALKDIKVGDRCHYPNGTGRAYYVHDKAVWLPSHANTSTTFRLYSKAVVRLVDREV